MKFVIPTNDQLEQNITEKVIDSFAELVFVSKSGSYELRSSFRLLDAFDTTNKLSYGSLKSFADYCSKVVRYYRNPKAKTLLRQVIVDVNTFLNNNEYFLS